MTWEPIVLETDEDAATVRILQRMAQLMPGWVPVDGAPEVVLAQEIGRESANVARTAVEAMDLAVAGIGESVHGVAPYAATAATVPVQIHATPGSTVPAGLTVVARNPVGVDVAFVLGQDRTQVATVDAAIMTATVASSDGNGIPAGTALQIVTATEGVTQVVATAASAGGVDAEPLASYLDRLRDYLQILHPAGVLGRDLAQLLRVTVPAVHRAIAIDGWDDDLQTGGHERTVTVFALDAAGQTIDPAVIETQLASYREANLALYGARPVYTPLSVNFVGEAIAGADPEIVRANVIAAIADYLNPATWGSTEAEPLSWTNRMVVEYFPVLAVAGRVPGLRTFSSFTINDGVAGEYPLTGPIGLPAPLTGPVTTTITGTML